MFKAVEFSMAELLGLSAASFVAATLFPLPSEAALFAYLQAPSGPTALAVTVATRRQHRRRHDLLPDRPIDPAKKTPNLKAIECLRRYGSPATVFAWLPVVGDALCLAAGWLRMNWAAALAFMAAGRLARYMVVAALSS